MPARLALVVALVATLLLPGAAIAADPAADPSPSPGPLPAPPALTLTGGGIVAGSGAAWFIPTATDGQASLGVDAGDAGRTVGFQVDPVPAGWHLASGVINGRTVGFSFSWDAGAPDAVVAIAALDADGQASARAYLQLVSVAAPPLVGDAALDAPAIPVGFTPDLTWRESDGRGQGIARRVVSGEHAAPTLAGCPTEGWAPDADTVALDALALLTDDPAAPPAAREVPDPAVTARLPLPGLPAGCHRFRIQVIDALGQTADAVSPVLLVGPSPAPPSPPSPPSPAWSGKLDLFRSAAHVTQATSTWCIAAAALMMTNLALGRADRSAAIQAAFIAWAQKYDGLSGTVGTNAFGWTAILDRWSGADYEALYFGSFEAALRTAAVRIARTGKPVGIIVDGGKHAWVLHGFVAPANPARRPTTVRAVFVSGPLYSRRSRGYDPRPDTRLSLSDLRRFWRPLGAGYDNAGRWVLIAPVPQDAPGTDTALPRG
jgi:hypothetical protein